MNNPISKCKICLKNLCIDHVTLVSVGDIHDLRVGNFECLLLLTRGTVTISNGQESEKICSSHIFILEKDSTYTIVAEEEYTEIFEISALRNINGDIIPSDVLSRTDYPFDTHKPFNN